MRDFKLPAFLFFAVFVLSCDSKEQKDLARVESIVSAFGSYEAYLQKIEEERREAEFLAESEKEWRRHCDSIGIEYFLQ